jgi:DNA-directed RNA polymerase specialized sigma24 family protein
MGEYRVEEVIKYLKALLALQIATYETSESAERAEVLLARAGLAHGEIAELTGKSYAAVAKRMSRAKRRDRQ